MQFIVDVNLPKHFSFFNHPDFVFAADNNLKMSDTDIWKLALDKDYVSGHAMTTVQPSTDKQ